MEGIVGFLYHVDDEESWNRPLPASGEILLLSSSDFTPVTYKTPQNMDTVT
jgi:hypothetical protein